MMRCPECRTRRVDPALMVLHRLHCTRPLCHCEGVPFEGGLAAHRPGARGCDSHPLAPLTRAERRGESPAWLAYIAARMPGPDVPF
jgi:hypothetical protein